MICFLYEPLPLSSIGLLVLIMLGFSLRLPDVIIRSFTKFSRSDAFLKWLIIIFGGCGVYFAAVACFSISSSEMS